LRVQTPCCKCLSAHALRRSGRGAFGMDATVRTQVERRAVPALDEAPWYVDCVRFGRTLLRFDNAS
jgi:hypothetical protein